MFPQTTFISITSLLLLLFPSVVFAADDMLDKLNKIAVAIGIATVEPGQAQATIGERIGTILLALMSFLGVIFILLVIYAGFKWMTARGNEDQVEKSKKIIETSVIGLLVIALAYAFTQFIGILLGGLFKK